MKVPGDKSISHRAAMLGAMAEGTTRIRNFLPASDCLSTLEVVRGLGIEVEYSRDEVLVHGRGLKGWREPDAAAGVRRVGHDYAPHGGPAGGSPLYSVLAGNAQLSRRPMDRVAVPLRQMGATILGEAGRQVPAAVHTRRQPESNPVRDARRKRAGEVGGAAGRAIRAGSNVGGGERDHTRPHREDADRHGRGVESRATW